MAADLMPEDDFPAALLNARVRFWMCINRAHKNVVWDGDVAKCPDCGVTSEMTTRYAARVREQVAREIESASYERDVINHVGADFMRRSAQIARGER